MKVCPEASILIINDLTKMSFKLIHVGKIDQ